MLGRVGDGEPAELVAVGLHFGAALATAARAPRRTSVLESIVTVYMDGTGAPSRPCKPFA